MPTVKVETNIEAPPERVFDLARDVRIHTQTSTGNEKVLFATQDLLELGDEVEFEATHLGFRQRLRARITAYDRPHSFTDEQLTGPFRSFRHRHEFHPTETGTHMVDIFEFESLAAPIAAGVMKRFLIHRGIALKTLAESTL